MSKKTIILLHIAFWVMMFLSPLTLMHRGETFSLLKYVMVCVSPLALMVVFYVNYLWLVPTFFFGRDRRPYWLVNLLLMVAIGISVHYWLSFTHGLFDTPDRPHHPWSWVEDMAFIIRDSFNVAVTAAVATAIALAERVHHSEEARLEAEAARTEAELKNLRSQINPHFLLNTLNNIYALTAIDTKRAQDAIQQLSKLLRHLLYENEEQLVDLDKEMQFIESYINLMRIRLPQNVDVSFTYEPPSKSIRVVPLLTVSLVENAFKHGISPTEPSFVHIRIAVDGFQAVCDIENSNHPKTEKDRSGHGIGLQQVQHRLDLCYPGRYEWNYGPSADGKTYRSVVRLDMPSINN